MNSSIVTMVVGSDLMLYDSVKDEVHILNATARVIYELHCAGKNQGEIEEAVRKSFTIAADHNVSDNVQECLAELKDKGLILENS